MDKVSLGSRIRAARTARGVTQLDLAKGVGCDPSTLSLVERGQVDTSAKLVAGIAEFLQVTTDSLLLESESADPSTATA